MGQGQDLDLCPRKERLEVVGPGPHFQCLDRHATALLVLEIRRSAGVGPHCAETAGVGPHCTEADIGPHVGPHWFGQSTSVHFCSAGVVPHCAETAGDVPHCTGADIGPHVGPHWLRQLASVHTDGH